jgi:hypothetical protein
LSLRLSLLHHLFIIYKYRSFCLVVQVDFLLDFCLCVCPNLIKKLQNGLLPHKRCKIKNMPQHFFFVLFHFETHIWVSQGVWEHVKIITQKNLVFQISFPLYVTSCHSPNLGLTTKAKACKVANQEGSLGITSHVPRSAKECKGMNPHTPKWTPILGIRLPNFQRAIVGVKTHWIQKFVL